MVIVSIITGHAWYGNNGAESSGASQSIKEMQLYLQKEYLGVATFVYQLNNDPKPSVIICKNQTCSNKLSSINEVVEYLSKSN